MDQRTAKAVEREFALYPIYLQAVERRQRREADRARPWPPAAPRPEAQPSNRPAVAVIQMSADPEYERARRSVAAIQATYQSLDPLERRFVELYLWRAQAREYVVQVLGISDRAFYDMRRRILEAGLRQLVRHEVPTFVDGRSVSATAAEAGGEG